jgi:hypothetical protein
MTPVMEAKSRPVVPLSLTEISRQPAPVAVIATAVAVAVAFWLRVIWVVVLKPVMNVPAGMPAPVMK